MERTEFTNIDRQADERTVRFTLTPVHVTYANTLRRLILTGVETVSFRADMTSTGTTTDVVVKRNDTPMTNEMLAARIGLLPVQVAEPLKWKDNEYQFRINVSGDADQVRHVTASDFEITQLTGLLEEKAEEPNSNPIKKTQGGVDDNDDIYDEKEEVNLVVNVPRIPSNVFFPPHPLTGQTCLLASLQPGSGASQQHIELLAKATKGTGREHARFSPVSQCSYEYTVDDDQARIQEMFQAWLLNAKKASTVDKSSERYAELEREFRTMQIRRCYKIDENGEPFSYDFTIESIGVLSVDYIIKRACEVGENMCSRYVNIQTGALPSEITISNANCRLIGFDFLFRGHDHTLGNLLQTWLVQHHIEGNALPRIKYAGFTVPHPLRDEMLLRIGVEDGEEATARSAVAAASRGCMTFFKALRYSWLRATGMAVPEEVAPVVSSVARSGRPTRPIPRPKTASSASASASTSTSRSISPTSTTASTASSARRPVSRPKTPSKE